MCTVKESSVEDDPLKNTINTIREREKITISPDKDPLRIVWKKCSEFKMFDYYTLVTNIKKRDAKYSKSKYWLGKASTVTISFSPNPVDTSEREHKRQAQRDASGKPAKYLGELYTEFQFFFNSNIIPLQAAIAPHSGVVNEAQDLIQFLSLFWNIKEFSPYAPLITMNALISGVPSGVRASLENFMDDIGSKINDLKSSNGTTYALIKGDKDNICDGLNTLVDHWKKSPKITAYSTYRGEASHSRDKHVERNFWRMIFFLKMQYELSKIKLASPETIPDIDLNKIYESFLLIWPYSPQLFIDVEDTDDLNMSDETWNKILGEFFKPIPVLQSKSQIYSALDKVSEIYPAEEKRYFANYLAFTERCILNLSDSEDAENGDCLVHGTPYFAAYYYLDDSWVHRMIHQEDGEKYKEVLFILLTSYARVPYSKMYFGHEVRTDSGSLELERENEYIIFLPSGKSCGPSPLLEDKQRKLLGFLDSVEGKRIRAQLDHYLDYEYYSLLCGASSLDVPKLRIWNEICRSVLKEIGHET